MDAKNKKAQDRNDVGHALLRSLIQMVRDDAEDEDGAGGWGALAKTCVNMFTLSRWTHANTPMHLKY